MSAAPRPDEATLSIVREIYARAWGRASKAAMWWGWSIAMLAIGGAGLAGLPPAFGIVGAFLGAVIADRFFGREARRRSLPPE